MGGEERGYDGGKKVEGRKRHPLVDTEGFVPKANVRSAAEVMDYEEGSRRYCSEQICGSLAPNIRGWTPAALRGRRWGQKGRVEKTLGWSVELTR